MNDKILEKNRKIGSFDMAEQASRIVEDTLVKEEQSDKDMNKFIYIFGIIAPCLALFQAYKIFYLQSAAAVSGVYWLGYLAVAAVWFGYGIYYKNKAIMFVYGFWIFVELVVLNGIYIYK